jgi:hypothetical protein
MKLVLLLLLLSSFVLQRYASLVTWPSLLLHCLSMQFVSRMVSMIPLSSCSLGAFFFLPNPGR